jgi:hypothetical protein
MTEQLAVYVTHGRKYHTDDKCPLMVGGEELWDGDGEDYFHAAGSFRRTERDAQYAAACGKLPCLHCVPAEQRAFPPLSGQTIGHKPVDLGTAIHEAWTNHSACQSCRARTTALVCARCMEFDTNRMWKIPAHPVHWPCTSAVVLGIEPRPTA